MTGVFHNNSYKHLQRFHFIATLLNLFRRYRIIRFGVYNVTMQADTLTTTLLRSHTSLIYLRSQFVFLARKKKMERELLAVLKWHVAICIYNAIENGAGKLCKNFLLVFHEYDTMAIFCERIICNIYILK